MRKGVRLITALSLLGLALVGCTKNAASIGASDDPAFRSADPELKAGWETALAAAKTNGYATAILTLKRLQTRTNLTPEQAKAIGETATAVRDQMYDAANKGDANAVNAIKELRQAMAR